MERKIRISEANFDKINAVIKKAEGYARERLLTADYLTALIKNAETKIGITKTAMNGTVAHIATDTGSYYGRKASKYYKECTIATVEMKNGVWYLIDVERTSCPEHMVTFDFSENAKMAIIEGVRYVR